jgi:hypothetical protein
VPLTQIALDIIQKRLEEYWESQRLQADKEKIEGTNGTEDIYESRSTPTETDPILKEVRDQLESSQD